MGNSQCCEKPLLVEGHQPIKLSSKKLMHYSTIRDIRVFYENLTTLGSGSFGKVRLFRSKLNPDLKYAIKTLKKDGISRSLLECLQLEVNILREIDHPNIVRFFATIEDNHNLHIVMDYLSGDNLSKIILNSNGILPERKICLIMKQLLKALAFLEIKGIVHRDVKPENILFSQKGDLNTLNLIDFGLAQYMRNKDKKSCGSPYFMSPEIIRGKFCPKTDVWAAGVILYYILTDKYPFVEDREGNIFQNILKKPLNIRSLKKSRGSPQVVDLITKLLVKDPEQRLSAAQALEHPWFKKYEVPDEDDEEEIARLASLVIPNDEIVQSLKNFCTKTFFQKEILFFIAKISIEDDIRKIKDLFLKWNVKNSAELSKHELKKGIKYSGIRLTDSEIDEIWENLDFHKNNKVNYTDFLAAMIDINGPNIEQKLISSFVFFDQEEGGFIKYEAFETVTESFHLDINKEEIKKTFDLFPEGIDYNSYKKILFGQIQSF